MSPSRRLVPWPCEFCVRISRANFEGCQAARRPWGLSTGNIRKTAFRMIHSRDEPFRPRGRLFHQKRGKTES